MAVLPFSFSFNSSPRALSRRRTQWGTFVPALSLCSKSHHHQRVVLAERLVPKRRSPLHSDMSSTLSPYLAVSERSIVRCEHIFPGHVRDDSREASFSEPSRIRPLSTISSLSRVTNSLLIQQQMGGVCLSRGPTTSMGTRMFSMAFLTGCGDGGRWRERRRREMEKKFT